MVVFIYVFWYVLHPMAFWPNWIYGIWKLSESGVLLGLFFDPEDAGIIFL
jgi:hypothetical protein